MAAGRAVAAVGADQPARLEPMGRTERPGSTGGLGLLELARMEKTVRPVRLDETAQPALWAPLGPLGLRGLRDSAWTVRMAKPALLGLLDR